MDTRALLTTCLLTTCLLTTGCFGTAYRDPYEVPVAAVPADAGAYSEPASAEAEGHAEPASMEPVAVPHHVIGTVTPVPGHPVQPSPMVDPLGGDPVKDRDCGGEVDGAELTFRVRATAERVTLECGIVGADGVERYSAYQLAAWNAEQMRCDHEGWIFATAGLVAYVVIPDSGGDQARLDCAIEPSVLP